MGFNSKQEKRAKEYMKNYIRERSLKQKYNLTIDEYNKLLTLQDNKCLICNKIETNKDKSGKIKNLAVDHCHKTGKIRGLLCCSCNLGLGYFKEETESLKNAIEYLKKNKS